jgi:hypothetical protein
MGEAGESFKSNLPPRDRFMYDLRIGADPRREAETEKALSHARRASAVRGTSDDMLARCQKTVKPVPPRKFSMFALYMLW